MKTLILSLVFLFASPACTLLTPNNSAIVESVGRPIAVLQVKKYAEKKSKNKLNLIKLSVLLDNYSKSDITLSDFSSLAKEAGLDSDWVIVLSSIYQSNKDKLSSEKASKVASYISLIIKDAVLLADNSK